MTDRAEMPYTEAVICEILRCGNTSPLGVWHTSSEPIAIGDLTIAAYTMINALYVSLLKGDYWENGFIFNPERFLNKDGTLRKDEHFTAFSIGKRICLGETLAKTELFLFFTGTLSLISHKYTILYIN